MKTSCRITLLSAVLTGLVQLGGIGFAYAETTFLKAPPPHDPMRELYKNHNEALAKHCKTESGKTVTITQSHGGSGKQA